MPEEQKRYPLRGTVIQYINPTAPVAEEDWEVLDPDASVNPTDLPRSRADETRENSARSEEAEAAEKSSGSSASSASSA